MLQWEVTEIVKLSIAAAGFAALLKTFVKGTFFERKPFTCPLCMGFWFGASVGIFQNGGFVWSVVMDGFFFAWIAWVLNVAWKE